MNVKGFKLIDGGFGGLKVEIVQSIKKGNLTVLDNDSKTRRWPLPQELRKEIMGLRYYLLVLSRHWVSSWDSYLNEDCSDIKEVEEEDKVYDSLAAVFDETVVTGVDLIEGRLRISGKIAPGDGPPMTISPPWYYDTKDQFGFFDTLYEKILNVFESVANYLKTFDLEMNSTEAKEILLRNAKGDEDCNRIANMSDEECQAEMVTYLEDRGAVVVDQEEVLADALEDNTSTEESEEDIKNEFVEDTPEEEDAPPPKGEFVSEEDSAEPSNDEDAVETDITEEPEEKSDPVFAEDNDIVGTSFE